MDSRMDGRMDRSAGECPLFKTAVQLVELMDPWTRKQISHVFLLLLACAEDGPLDMAKVEVLRRKLSEEPRTRPQVLENEGSEGTAESGELAEPGVNRISA